MHSLNDTVRQLDPKRRKLLEALLRQQGVDLGRSVLLPRERGAAGLPLSFAQERLWFLDQLTPGSATYNMPLSVRLRGDLDPAVVARCFAEVRRRHEVLRTRFVARDGVPAQVADPPDGLSRPASLLPIVDISALPPAARGSVERRLAAEEFERPFDLARGPVLRTSLLRLAPREHALLVTIHHVATDAWSMDLLVRELSALYAAVAAGRPSPLPPLNVQYGDYAAWQREHLADGEAQVAYWRERLAGLPPLELPADRPRPAVQTYNGAAVQSTLPPELTGALAALGRGADATLFMVLLAGFQALLGRWSGQADFAVGSPIAGRGRPELEGLIGCFLNTLVLRADLAGGPSFRELIGRVRETALGAFAHQDVPFERLLAELQPERELSRTPLFQVFFNLLNVPAGGAGELRLPGLSLEPVQTPQEASKFDLTLYLEEVNGEMRLNLVYNADLFDALRMAELLDQYEALLTAAAARPAELVARHPLLTARAAAVLPDPAQPLAGGRGGTIHEAVLAAARRAPDRVAVAAGERQVRYGELAAAALGLAGRLRAAGVMPGEVVAVHAARTTDLPAALLGVLAAGAAFLVLDPAYPGPRRAARLRLARPAAWIDLLGGPLPAEVAAALEALPLRLRLDVQPTGEGSSPLPAVAPDDLAYLAFTSGSTGEPKGILGNHRPVAHFLEWQAATFGLGPDDRFALLAGLAHDPLLRDLFAPLALGATLCVPDGEALEHPDRFAAWLVGERVSAVHLTPALSWVLAAADPAITLPDLRHAFFGGDVLTAADVSRLRRRAPAAACVNFYGATETPQAMGWHAVPVEAEAGEAALRAWPVPLGRGIDGVQLLVVNPAGGQAGIAELGEVCIRTPYLSRGYLDPDLTRERFPVNPFRPGAGSGDQRDRLYRTGDLGRFRPDGAVEPAGRADRQVKVRGYRVEPAEVEAALTRDPWIAEAAVRAWGEGENRRLVAWVAPRPGSAVAVEALRAALERQLPAPLVPATFVLLERLPRTPNNKVDLAALPAPEPPAARARSGDAGAAPTPFETVLAGIFAEALGFGQVGPEDDFFDLGGHSLLALRLRAAVQRALGVDLPLRLFFEARTVRRLAREVAVRRSGGAGAAEEATAALPCLVPDLAQRHEPFPLTDLQEAYWVGRTGAVEMGNVASHRYLEFEAEGIDVDRLERAWRRLVERHDMLRAVILPDGRQRILAEVPPYRIEVLDLRRADAGSAARQVDAVRERMSHQVFAPDRWPLFEIRACRTGGDRVRLHFGFDYLLADAWSFRLLVRELSQLYRDPLAPLAPLALSFRDYVLALREMEGGEAYRRAWDYWQERLATLAPAPELPLVRPAAGLDRPRFVRRTATLAPAPWQGLQRRAARSGLTPSGLLLAAFGEVLAAWSKSPRFTLVLTLFDRLPLHPEVDRLLGDFTSTVLLELGREERATFEERARGLQEQLWTDLDHNQVSGVRVLRELARREGRGLRAVMPVVFTSTLDLERVAGAGAGAELGGGAPDDDEPDHSITQTPQVWLDHVVSEEAGTLVLVWDAVDELFPDGLLDDMFAAYRGLLGRLAESEDWALPAPVLPPPAQLARRAAVNATQAPLPAPQLLQLLHGGFLARAAAAPGQPALLSSRRRLTYGELAAESEAVARSLLARSGSDTSDTSGTRDQLVAVVMEKGWEQAVATLGVLRAGAAYLPVDPALPRERFHHLLARGEVRLALTQPRFLITLDWPADVEPLAVGEGGLLRDTAAPATGPLPTPAPGDLAYVIFTSGSTGEPKGVAIEHRAAVNTLADVNRRFGVGEEDRVLALSSLGFDLSVWDLFGVLAAGGAVVLPDPGARRDPAAWVRLLAGERVTLWNTVPALLEMLVEHLAARSGERPRDLRLALLSGDWIPLNLPDRARRELPGLEVVSLGGATEAAVWSIFFPVGEVDPAWRSVPYGRPLANQTWQVLDGRLSPRPDHVPGDLYIGGLGLAREYWRDRARTDASFLIHPATGERLYRTGDLGRWLPDGILEFLGREDGQVKVQGYRIETGEVEAALLRHPAVREAAVVAAGDLRGERRLVGSVVLQEGAAADPADLRSFLAERLPAYMVPAQIATLPALPLGPNGKVDRRALAALGERGTEGAAAALAEPRPAGPPGLVDRVAALVAEALGRDAVDPGASLLELGASSIELVRIANRIEDEFGVRPEMDQLFHLPLARAVAGVAVLRAAAPAPAPDAAPPDSPSDRGEAAGLFAWTPLRDPGERERFKESQPGLRRLPPEAPRVALARPPLGPELERAYTGRRSRRRFAERPLAQEQLGLLLAPLRQLALAGAPKYRYGSAGGLYPVQVYLYAKPGAIEGLAAGSYYYHPVEHVLHPVSATVRLTRDHYGWVNQPVFDAAGFALFLIGELRAIGPLYGDLSRDFCLIEAGLMTQVLESEAPAAGVGLCQVGRLEFDRVRHGFALEPGQVYLHSLLGGPIDPETEAPGSLEEPEPPADWDQGEL